MKQHPAWLGCEPTPATQAAHPPHTRAEAMRPSMHADTRSGGSVGIEVKLSGWARVRVAQYSGSSSNTSSRVDRFSTVGLQPHDRLGYHPCIQAPV